MSSRSAARDVARIGARALWGKLFLPVLVLALALCGILGLAGIIGSTTDNGSSDTSGLCAATGAHGSAGSIPGGNAADRKGQIAIAKQIDEGVKELGFSGQASRIVIIAAMGESTLSNISYGDDIHGVRNPDGTLTSSIGILQQQEWWGTKEERMSPKTAAQLFILGAKRQGGGLADVTGWQNMGESAAIHAVQGNADPSHYTRSISYADGIIKEAGIDINREGKTNGSGQKKDTKAVDETDLSTSCSNAGVKGGNSNGKDTYPWAALAPAPGVYTLDGAGFYYGECTSYAMWKLAEHYGAKDKNNPSTWAVGNTKGGNGAKLGNGAEWRDGWEARGWKVSTTPTANSVAWYAAEGAQGIGGAGHVAWVDSVESDGKHFVISEYNNSYLAPPGHKYSKRDPMTMDAPDAPNAFLIPPDANQLKG